MKVAKLMSSTDSQSNDLGDLVWIWCPGCESYHTPRVRQGIAVSRHISGLWTWNANEESPTINPSILVWASEPELRCHSFVKDGNIQFLSDCAHKLKGLTVPLPELDL